MGKSKEATLNIFGEDKPKDEMVELEEEITESGKMTTDCVSAWMKAVRLRRLEDSMYWAHVIVDHFSMNHLVRRMAIFAGEDCWDPQAIPLTAALMDQVERKVPDIWNHVYYVNWYLLQCPKFWETEGGVAIKKAAMALEKRWAGHTDEKERIIPEPIPSWAIDMHTKLGREYASGKEWDKIDRRFGGDEIGMLTKILMFKKYGRLDIEDGMDCYWAAYNILKKHNEEIGRLCEEGGNGNGAWDD